ncbi:hypothetical protein MKW94_028795 [Papaver nudicaule]|uniref:Uncharacterized protein n=1 Tax=Papaver nudicaule TaxID=74823 RepID=A0AA41V1H5_PAPNU|nr:hypothetical protein [Papaver nudicaule]
MQSDVWGSINDQGVVTHITGGNFAQSSITINGLMFLFSGGIQLAYALMKIFIPELFFYCPCTTGWR